MVDTTKYKACVKCYRAAKGDVLPLLCPEKHETNVINLRFKLEVEVEYNADLQMVIIVVLFVNPFYSITFS